MQRTDDPLLLPDDDLLRPTLGAHGPRDEAAPKPWALGSQVYVAFFGGALAAAAIAVLNAERLRLTRTVQAQIAAFGLLGLAATIVLAELVDDVPTIARRAVALAAWGGMWLLQRGADRRWVFHSRDEEPYAPLWTPGIIAVLAGGLLQAGILAAITGEVG